jgi:hypothetical protein
MKSKKEVSPGRFWTGIFLFALCLQFCRAETNKVQAAASADIPAPEYVAFAHKLERDLSTRHYDSFAKALDMDALLEKALSGITATDKTKQGFREGFDNGFTNSFARSFSVIKSYKLLRLTNTNGECHALYRVLVQGGGMNYHDLFLKSKNGGPVRIVDFYIALTGEPVSVTVRRVALPIMADRDKTFLQHLFGDEQDLIKYQAEWTQVITLCQNKKYSEALSVYEELPLSLQQEKFLLVQRLKAAQAIGDTEYQKALDFWRRCYPKDVSLPLVMIDAYTIRKQYDKALDSVDQLDKIIGGDPYLKVQRAYLFKVLNQPDKAVKMAEAAIAEEPSLAQAYDCLLAVSLSQKDYKKTAQYLTAAEQALHINLSRAVDELDDYADFRRTSAFTEWKAERSGKAAE